MFLSTFCNSASTRRPSSVGELADRRGGFGDFAAIVAGAGEFFQAGHDLVETPRILR